MNILNQPEKHRETYGMTVLCIYYVKLNLIKTFIVPFIKSNLIVNSRLKFISVQVGRPRFIIYTVIRISYNVIDSFSDDMVDK